MGLFTWFKELFNIMGGFIKRACKLAEPFLQEVLSRTAKNVWDNSQDLFISAAQYVAIQGLPTTEAKQKAFKDYLVKRSKEEINDLKDSEINLLREMAVVIVKKVTKHK